MYPITTTTDCITGFVGRTLRGPVNTPVLVRSFANFQHVFGGLWQPSTLSYALEHYFDHGGRAAYVVRVANGGASATLSLSCGAGVLVLQALALGSREFLRAAVDYDGLDKQDVDCFNLVVHRLRAQHTEHIEEQETFRRVSISPTTNRYVLNVLLESKLVRVKGAVPTQRPDVTHGAGTRFVGYVQANPDGSDGEPLTDYDLIGSATQRTGMFALAQVERLDYLYLPPLTREQDVGVSALLVASRFCHHRHAMLIVDPPRQWQSSQTAVQGMRAWNLSSDNALMCFPRLMTLDRLRNHVDVFANGGAVAGMLAHSEDIRPVWDARHAEPALLLKPNVRLQFEISELDRWRLNAHGVNVLQAVRRAADIQVLRRTLAGGANSAADFGYVGSRRFILWLVANLLRQTRWVLLAQPGRAMWARLLKQLNGYLSELAALGAFPSAAPDKAYFVICDERVNAVMDPDETPPINILVGVAATRPEQYHCFLLSHSLLGSDSRLVAVNRYETPSVVEDAELTARVPVLQFS